MGFPTPRSGKKEFEVTKVTKTNPHLGLIECQTIPHLLMILSFFSLFLMSFPTILLHHPYVVVKY